MGKPSRACFAAALKILDTRQGDALMVGDGLDAELREHDLPILALTTKSDGVIPHAAFEALCSAVGTEGRTLSGRHSWLLTDPDSFDDVLANVVEVRVSRRQERLATSRATLVSDALRPTTIPTRRARTWLRDAPPLWLMSAPPFVLAGDLALCHPKLERGEVRAVARPFDGSKTVRLTVAAQDRRGLLGDTTGVFAHHGFCITDASAATWTKQHLALHALTVDNAAQIDATEWDQLGDNLRTICAAGHQERPDFVPLGHATVYGNQRQRTLIRILAPDHRSVCCRRSATGSPTTTSVSSPSTLRQTERPHTTSSSSRGAAALRTSRVISAASRPVRSPAHASRGEAAASDLFFVPRPDVSCA